MDDLLKFITQFLISPGLPEKKEKSYIKIVVMIVLTLIVINLAYYIFFY